MNDVVDDKQWGAIWVTQQRKRIPKEIVSCSV